jgi:hypothetical protein
MIRDAFWALSLSAPGANGAANGAAGMIAPENAPRRLAVIDSPVPAGASLIPGTTGYRLRYPCASQGNGQSTASTVDQSFVEVDRDQVPKWAFWIPATAAGLFILDWVARRRKR